VPYRVNQHAEAEVLLGHMGGPFWKSKQRSWSILKGESRNPMTPRNDPGTMSRTGGEPPRACIRLLARPRRRKGCAALSGTTLALYRLCPPSRC
jgi:hypothetical protein